MTILTLDTSVLQNDNIPGKIQTLYETSKGVAAYQIYAYHFLTLWKSMINNLIFSNY